MNIDKLKRKARLAGLVLLILGAFCEDMLFSFLARLWDNIADAFNIVCFICYLLIVGVWRELKALVSGRRDPRYEPYTKI